MNRQLPCCQSAGEMITSCVTGQRNQCKNFTIFGASGRVNKVQNLLFSELLFFSVCLKS